MDMVKRWSKMGTGEWNSLQRRHELSFGHWKKSEKTTRSSPHLVCATCERHPLITWELRPVIYAGIQAEFAALKAELLATGCTSDHGQLLVRIPASLAASDVVRQVDGSTSLLVSLGLGESIGFKWQGG